MIFGTRSGAWALWVDAGNKRARVRSYDARMVMTLGAGGCWYETGAEHGLMPGVPARVVDAIGATIADEAGRSAE